jgi:hypothetical protein
MNTQTWTKPSAWCRSRRVMAVTMLRDAAAAWGFTLADLRSHRKDRRLVKARRHAVQKLYENEFSSVQIAALLNRHHTGVLYLLGHLGRQSNDDHTPLLPFAKQDRASRPVSGLNTSVEVGASADTSTQSLSPSVPQSLDSSPLSLDLMNA